MPIALAFLISAGIHLAALLSPAWEFPDLMPAEEPLEAILLPPPVAPMTPAPPVATPPQATKHKKIPVRPTQEQLAAKPPVLTTPASNSVMSPALPGAAGTESSAEGAATTTTSAVSPAPTFLPDPITPPVPIALPAQGRLRFIITRGDMGLIIGQNIYTWEQDGSHYTARSISETTGLVALFKSARVIQESRGEITAAGLRPTEFSSQRKGGIDTAHFDWAAGTLTYAGREEPLPADTQDMLSMYYQLGLFVAMQADVPLVLTIATGRKLARYHVEQLGEQAIFYRDGKYQAQHLKTQNNGDTIELWIAREVSSLPIRIRLTDRKGQIFDQLAEETTFNYSNETH